MKKKIYKMYERNTILVASSSIYCVYLVKGFVHLNVKRFIYSIIDVAVMIMYPNLLRFIYTLLANESAYRRRTRKHGVCYSVSYPVAISVS